MTMASIGGGLAAGLESGFGMAQRVLDSETRKNEHDREFKLRESEAQDRSRRQKTLDERADADYGLKVAQEHSANTVGDFAAAIQQYGSFETAPLAVKARLAKQSAQAGGLLDEARGRRHQLAFGTQLQGLKDVTSNLNAGRVQLADVPDEAFTLAVAQSAGRSPADFLPGADGAPSRVQGELDDLVTGVASGNQGQALRGANGLYAWELARTKGQPGRHGGTILGSEIVQFIPHPGDPSKVTPVLKVYVDQGKDFKGPRGENGATGYYMAPLTDERLSHSDAADNVRFLDMAKIKEYAGQVGALGQTLQNPEAAEKIKRGIEALGPEVQRFLDRYRADGQAAVPKKQISSEQVRTTEGVTRIEKDARGRATSERFFPNAARAARGSEKAASAEEIRAMYEAGEITKEEFKDWMRAATTGMKLPGTSGAAPRGPAGGGKPSKVSEASVKGLLKNVEGSVLSVYRLTPDKDRPGQYRTAKGLPADDATTAEVNGRLEAAQAFVRNAAAKGEQVGMTDAMAAAGSAKKAAQAAPQGPLPQRPAGVPKGALYSPKTKTWWVGNQKVAE